MARALVASVLCVVVASCSGGNAAPRVMDASSTAPPASVTVSRQSEASIPELAEVEHWLYVLDVDLELDTVDEVIESGHEMIVLDFIPSEANNTDYPMAEVVSGLHNAPTPKLVLAYIDIGEAEDFRTYWEASWEPGDPEWIVGYDPDGWEGNFPVAFWWDEWQEIWLGNGGQIEAIVDAGFDGVYLDWVEAYSDEQVIDAAAADGLDAREEMIWWVTDIAERGRSLDSGFLVIAQNAAELVTDDDYASVIDGLAQEQVWFDGGADNDPPGDCPLPRMDADIETDDYVESLSDACRRQHDEFPESTLHVSSEEYLDQLAVARELGLPIFTVDYALDRDNIEWVYDTSRSLGFVPFVSSRALDQFVPTVP